MKPNICTNNIFIFYLRMPIVIFFISCNLTKRGIFSIARNRGVTTIFKLKTLPKNWKIHPIYTIDSKIEWIDFSGLSAKPEIYFSPTKIRKKQIRTINIEKHWPMAVLHILIQMLYIYSSMSSTFEFTIWVNS
jgi:hypothetical protein